MLAEELRMSESKLYQLERAERRPNPDDGPNIDRFFKVPGKLFTWLASISREAREPYGSLLAYEAQASAIRAWENRMIPGLLQTRAYAMALLRDEKSVDERLARRQKVFEKPEPASVRVVIDEAALRRIIGSKEIVAEQLAYLISDEAPWSLHVLPRSAIVYPPAADGPVMILDLEESTLAYGQGWGGLEGIMDTPGQVRAARGTWDAVLGLSLSTDGSRDMIRSLIGEFA
jgi:hypothetical protein